MSSIKLLCFPYAGGSAAVFNRWRAFLDPRIELLPVELAGKGSRIHESPYADLDEAVEDLFQFTKERIKQSQYAFFGHSMGALIVCELAQKIRTEDLPQPLHIFVSGRGAPHVKRDDEKIYHLMNDDEFKKEVLVLGGTPPEFFDYPELTDLFLPVLKNDFKIAETELLDRKIQPFNCDITVFLGKKDDLIAEECDGWKIHTKSLCNLHYFEGGHFFLNDETEQIVAFINSTLMGSRCIKSEGVKLIK